MKKERKKKKKVGRPTKYNNKILKKAWTYIASCKDDEGIQKKVKLPKAEGLAIYLDVSRDTLYEWASKHKEFSDILEAINQEQIERLINNGLSGFYNSTIAKLVLAKHGYKEETKTDLTSGGEQIKTINYIIPNDSKRKDADNFSDL